jgi:hypothetical protein
MSGEIEAASLATFDISGFSDTGPLNVITVRLAVVAGTGNLAFSLAGHSFLGQLSTVQEVPMWFRC